MCYPAVDKLIRGQERQLWGILFEQGGPKNPFWDCGAQACRIIPDNQRIQSKMDRKEAAWAEKGFGGKLFSIATSLATEGVKRAATGKSLDTRMFEKQFTNYICGDSPKAKEYFLKFAVDFGVDGGVITVDEVIRRHF